MGGLTVREVRRARIPLLWSTAEKGPVVDPQTYELSHDEHKRTKETKERKQNKPHFVTDP